jgi:hypothetical protein
MAESPANGKAGIKQLWDNVKDKIRDLGTIDVTTLEGNVTVKVGGDGQGDLFNLDDLFKALKAQVKDGSSLTLVAHTHVDFDLDAVMISKPEPPSALLEAHGKAVQTAMDARAAVLKIVTDIF